MKIKKWKLVSLAAAMFFATFAFSAEKPRLTLDEFFNAVSINTVRISPDGHAIVIATEGPDWNQEIFRKDLWLYCDGTASGSALVQLTQSEHDTEPQWSPDGRWIAFLSDRKVTAEKESGGKGDEDKNPAQIYLISINGGEAFAATHGDEEVHAFAWAPDSQSLYFATRAPWSKAQNEANKKDWKDVIRYRESERGDGIDNIRVADAIAHSASQASKSSPEKETGATTGARVIGNTPLRVRELAVSPDSRELAFATGSISERFENPQEYEIFLLDAANNASPRQPAQLTHNNAEEEDIRWTPDGKNILFTNSTGGVEGKYEDVQRHIYSVDVSSGKVSRWAADFDGNINSYTQTPTGVLLAACRTGTEVPMCSEDNPTAKFIPAPSLAGTYSNLSIASRSPRVAFVYSSLQQPPEVYVADDLNNLKNARAITAFNKLFTERELPQGKPYQWTADDGSKVEGMLIYPPGKFGAKNLRMLTLIHGGPGDADGNHFEADWYQWSALAAIDGWLVFQPNYRGSTGYGDKFMLGIIPKLVSRPGKDILEGIDALVKDGIADPNRLTIGGYSYGGYMTNWLITQTTRFKAAVTGAGAVEHAANWGNDDLTYDDAYFLGGAPWEAQKNYNDEAALFQMNKVRTPTHLVGGADDIRVSVAEDYLLERALQALNIPHAFLVFPGEGHGLRRNPWHGKIKVREELKWLDKYVPAQ